MLLQQQDPLLCYCTGQSQTPLLSRWCCSATGRVNNLGGQKSWDSSKRPRIRILPGRLAAQEPLLLVTPEELLQQQLQQAPVSLLLC